MTTRQEIYEMFLEDRRLQVLNEFLFDITSKAPVSYIIDHNGEIITVYPENVTQCLLYLERERLMIHEYYINMMNTCRL